MKFKLLILIPIIVFGLSSYSQQQKATVIDYPENVNAPLTKTEKVMIEEVYQSEAKEKVFNNKAFLKAIKHLLRNRLLIYEELDAKKQKGKLLSLVPLFNTYNKTIKRDNVFNRSTFNPLKYQLDFFANGTYVYHIDDTNYYIQITSQHRKFK